MKSSQLIPPNWLPPKAKIIFKEVVDTIPTGHLAKIDTLAIALLADNMYIYREAVAEIEQNGIMMAGERGNVVKHGAITIKTSAFNAINALLGSLGLTPTGRKNLDITVTQESNTNAMLAQFVK